MADVAEVEFIATKWGGRTHVGLKGRKEDEEFMWKDGDELWGQKVYERDIKYAQGTSAEDVDRLIGDCGTYFASTEASDAWDAWVESL